MRWVWIGLGVAALMLVSLSGLHATVFGTVRGIVHDPQHRPIAGRARDAEIGHFGVVAENADQFRRRIQLSCRVVSVTIPSRQKLRGSLS